MKYAVLPCEALEVVEEWNAQVALDEPVLVFGFGAKSLNEIFAVLPKLNGRLHLHLTSADPFNPAFYLAAGAASAKRSSQ